MRHRWQSWPPPLLFRLRLLRRGRLLRHVQFRRRKRRPQDALPLAESRWIRVHGWWSSAERQLQVSQLQHWLSR
jgi:hypothetical protein